MSTDKEADTNGGGGWIAETLLVKCQEILDSCFIRQDGGGWGWGGGRMGTTHICALKPHAGSVLALSPL